MTDITLTNEQNAGVNRRIVDGSGTKRTAPQQVARIFGYAGCGKSTILRFILDDLGLSPHRSNREDGSCIPGVVTATFTGKAAHVLRGKGHAGAYHPQPDLQRHRGDRGGDQGRSDRRIDDAEHSAGAVSRGFERTSAYAGIETMKKALAQMKKPRFALNSQSDAAEAKLIGR